MGYFLRTILYISLITISNSMEISKRSCLIDHQAEESINQDGTIQIKYTYTYGHNAAFKPEQLEGMILKGKEICHTLLNDMIHSFPHTLNYLKNYNDFQTPRYFTYFTKDHESIAIPSYQGTSYIRTAISYIPLINRTVSPTLTPEEIEKEKAYIDQRQARLESIICLVWYLCDESYKRGDVFNRGAFVIEDTDNKIHNFLEEYCCFAARVPSPEALCSAVYNYKGSNFAYKRTSSHFKNKSITHYGIDPRFVNEGFSVEVLPFSMTHILIGRVKNCKDKPLTFIKPEGSGMGDLRSTICHGFDYFSGGSKSELMRREKDIPLIIADEFFQLLKCISEFSLTLNKGIETQDSLILDRIINGEEWLSPLLVRIEQNKLTKETLLSTLEREKPDFCLLNKKIEISLIGKNIDIALMASLTKHIRFHKKIPHGPIKQQAIVLFNTMKNYYPINSLHLRTGNEVIFLHKELIQSN